MKRSLGIFLAFFSVYLVISLSSLDKHSFVCPVPHRGDLVIRSDSRGEGYFAASRSGGRRMHNGIDLFAPIGSPVLAPRSGRVVAAQQSNGMGKYVVLEHGGRLTTVYGHLSEIVVRMGASVRQGQVIGAVGKTGNANHPEIKPHLHFEVKEAGVPQDPLCYLE